VPSSGENGLTFLAKIFNTILALTDSKKCTFNASTQAFFDRNGR
jgi:hypothetical protein